MAWWYKVKKYSDWLWSAIMRLSAWLWAWNHCYWLLCLCLKNIVCDLVCDLMLRVIIIESWTEMYWTTNVISYSTFTLHIYLIRINHLSLLVVSIKTHTLLDEKCLICKHYVCYEGIAFSIAGCICHCILEVYMYMCTKSHPKGVSKISLAMNLGY